MEFTIPDEELISKNLKEVIEDSYWILHIDGASNSKGSRAALILASPEGVVTEYAIRFNFNISNNGAKYEALTTGLKMANKLGIKKLKVFTDSQLVVRQYEVNLKLMIYNVSIFVECKRIIKRL